jgi:short-subunit dehydrogenase
MKLDGRTVLITGASRGIGAATARAFAASGVRLALLARSSDRLQALAGELNRVKGVQTLPVVADVGQKDEVVQAVARVEQVLGPVDILVNNAGVGMRSPVGDMDLMTAQQVFTVNFWGAIHCIEAVLPAMRARGDGLIINISSIIGRRAMPHAAIYCASKFALNALSESLRLELHPDNVRVVTFYPGVTRTEFSRNELSGDASNYSRNRAPKTPVEDTAKAIVRACQREPRDAYATLFDRVFVCGATLAPGLMDRMLLRFYR